METYRRNITNKYVKKQLNVLVCHCLTCMPTLLMIDRDIQ